MSSSSTQSDITLTVNGETHAFPAPPTVADLLQHLGLEGKPAAVERNRHVVRKPDHAITVLSDGDTLEIVTLVGGG